MLVRPDDPATEDGRRLLEGELEASDDRIVAAPTAQRPEQVGILVCAHLPQLPRGVHHIERGDAVRDPAERPAEPAQPTAERHSGDADHRGAARQGGESVLGGRALQGAGGDPRADPRPAVLGVDLDLGEPAGAEQDAAGGPSGGTVTVRLGRDREPGRSREPDEAGHIRGVLGLDHGRDLLVDGQVPRLARLLEAAIAREPDSPADGGR